MAAGRLSAVLVLAALLALPAAPAWALGQPERLLVSLDGPAESQLRAAVQRLGGRVLEEFPFAHVSLVEVPAASVPLLRALPGVANLYAEERLQLLLSSSRPAVRVGPDLWDAGLDGRGVAVAVVDSGIDDTHPALQGRVLRAVRVDGTGVHAGGGDADGHGTHIAGIVAGDGSASPGRAHAGMAPKASLVAVDISSAFTTTNAVRSFQWLHDHAAELGLRVVSNSWGREKEDAAYDPDDPVIRASDALVRDGIVVVFSAGNLGGTRETLTVEAQNPNVLTVGATSDEGRIEAYSSRGPARHKDGTPTAWAKPDLVAPGSHITSTRAGASQGGEAYTSLHGTSMAAPHVAGVVALMLQANPTLAPAEVKALLVGTARDAGEAGHDIEYGAGVLDGERAVQAAAGLAAQPVEPHAQPFRGSGEVMPAAGLLPETPLPSGDVRIPVAVPPGTIAMEFTLRWDDPDSRFTVHLEKGERRLGPFDGATRSGGWMELRGRVDEGLEPGAWELVAEPRGPSLAARYEVEGAVLVRTSAATGWVPLGGAHHAGGLADLEAQSLLMYAALGVLAVVPAVLWVARRERRRQAEAWVLDPLPPAPARALPAATLTPARAAVVAAAPAPARAPAAPVRRSPSAAAYGTPGSRAVVVRRYPAAGAVAAARALSPPAATQERSFPPS